MKKNRMTSLICRRGSVTSAVARVLLVAVIMAAYLFSPNCIAAYAGETVNGDTAASYGDLAELTGGVSEFDFGVSYYDGTLEEYLEQHSGEGIYADTRTGLFSFPSVYSATGDNDGGGSYGYEQLTQVQKSLYDSMEIVINQFISSESYSWDIDSSTALIGRGSSTGALSISDAIIAFQCFFHDNPQYYWLESGTYLTATQNSTTVDLVADSYYYSAALRQSTDASIAEVSARWISQLSEIMNDGNTSDDAEDTYEVALVLHDLIIERIDYRYDGNKPCDEKYAHSIGGVFTGVGAVCEGYAKSFQYILNRLGIENIYIVGTASGDAHAWNSVEINGKHYLVDVTWDDSNNGTDNSSEPLGGYEYLCTPESLFDNSHRPYSNSGSRSWMYKLPDFANDTTYVYYMKYNSYASSAYDSSIESFVTNALASARGDFVYFLADNIDMLRLIYSSLGSGEFRFLNGMHGLVSVYQNISVEKPAEAISLENAKISADSEGKDSLALDIGSSEIIQAVLQPADSDDRIRWEIGDKRIASVSVSSGKATIRGKVNGTTTLTATAAKGGVSASCTIVVGTGEYSAEHTIWAKGSTEKKSVLVKTELTATSWKDAKGKTKKGKLVWLVRSERTEIEFNTGKHTVLTKSDKTYASVTSKGKVTAKKPGTVYVYACDTGTLTYEEYEIEILQAPEKLLLSAVANSTEKLNLVKKAGVAVGQSSTIYIVPYVKGGTADIEAEYTVKFAKDEYSKYLDISEVMHDAQGNAYFTVTGKDYLKDKNRPASVKLFVTNEQSGKKANCTIMVGNPVESVTSGVTPSTVATKKSTATITFRTVTSAGAGSKTTDKIKVYVAKTDAYVNGKKVVYDKGADIKARYDKNDKIVLTAVADAGTGAVIYIAFTDAVTKDIDLFRLAAVDEAGNITN